MKPRTTLEAFEQVVDALNKVGNAIDECFKITRLVDWIEYKIKKARGLA